MTATRRVRSGSRLLSSLKQIVLDQDEALGRLAAVVERFQAGLAMDHRPAGVVMALGPTGVGKSRTIEALAKVLHGDERNFLRVDCGEFQMEHEVAKLIGAPPGYLGHRETAPILAQHRLNAVASEKCNLLLLLLDEIEKAADSLCRLLLGVLDRGVLRLGDNTVVNFEHCLVYMTSNVGAREVAGTLVRGFGLPRPGAPERAEAVAMTALRRKFSPEFLNRIDEVLVFKPLKDPGRLLDLELEGLRELIDRRRGDRAFELKVSDQAREMIAREGFSMEYGVREMKRVIQRLILDPIARLAAEGVDLDGRPVAVVVRDGKVEVRVE